LSRATRAAALVATLVAAACSRTPSDPVRLMLAELDTAAEERDAARFAARLSGGFEGQDGVTKGAAEAELRRYFAGYESIRIERYDVEVDRSDGSARVKLKVAFSGQGRRAFGLENLLPPEALYRFDLEARDEDGTWRVTHATWERLEGPPPPQ
jgi:hypothetical protein